MRRHGLTFGLAIVVAVAACQPGGAGSVDDALRAADRAMADLRMSIEDVTRATAFRYRVRDDRGQWMGPMQIIRIPEASTFAATYFTWSDEDEAFHAHLATSDDLLDWKWRVELAARASMPTIAPASDGGYVVAWEQEPDPIHNVVAYFESWEVLLSGRPTRRFDVPVTMPACGEGTPSIESASSTAVTIGFHYHASCERDLQAVGTTDWSSWTASQRREIDAALIAQGVVGHIGDRDRITYRGVDVMLIEGETVSGEWGSWRSFLYDVASGSAQRLAIRTHAGSQAFSNGTLDLVEIEGREALLVTMYLFTEGARGEEDGELIYYRFVEP